MTIGADSYMYPVSSHTEKSGRYFNMKLLRNGYSKPHQYESHYS